jgi:NhaA family Na+:H+ antiporter
MGKFECEEQSCGHSILLNQEHMHAVHALELACHDVETPLQRLMHALHPWVAFTILPFFAMSNTGLTFQGMIFSEMATNAASLGIFFGLVFGKPLGVMLFSYLAVKTGAASLPKNVKWSHILGGAMLGGIGFTMSLLISDLSFSTSQILNYAKMAILLASVLSAMIGITFLGIISTTAPAKRSNSPDDL